MTYNTKAEFMAALKSQAEKYSLSFGEMAEDFERHFSLRERKTAKPKARYAQSLEIQLR